jgi:general secretion pathway protein G
MWRKAVLTLVLIATAIVAARLFLPTQVTSVREARDLAIGTTLHTLQIVLSQYTLDQHKRPHTLNDLVTAGYLKFLPRDPVTGRTDMWILECSTDRGFSGIVSIRRGDASAGKPGNQRCD